MNKDKKFPDYPSLLNPNWKYTKAADTDIRATFARARAEMMEAWEKCTACRAPMPRASKSCGMANCPYPKETA